MKKYLLGFSVIALIVSNHAYGADSVRYDDVPTPTPVADTPQQFSWEGAYIGAQVGGTWSETDVGGAYWDTVTPANNMSGLIWQPDPGGFSGGIYAGYNFDIGEPDGFVLGVETDFAWGSVDESVSDLFDLGFIGFPGIDLGLSARVKQEWSGATRMRLAYAADRWLPYVSAGVAYAKVKSSANAWLETGGTLIPGTAVSIGNNDTFTGWTVGTGADYAMTDNLLLRLEYRYSDYGDKTYTYDLGTGTDFASYTIDHKAHDARVGVAYKF